jgi:hypothetical protein
MLSLVMIHLLLAVSLSLSSISELSNLKSDFVRLHVYPVRPMAKSTTVRSSQVIGLGMIVPPWQHRRLKISYIFTLYNILPHKNQGDLHTFAQCIKSLGEFLKQRSINCQILFARFTRSTKITCCTSNSVQENRGYYRVI